MKYLVFIICLVACFVAPGQARVRTNRPYHVNLRWSGTNTVDGYQIGVRTNAVYFHLLDVGQTGTAVVSNLYSHTIYFFAVRSYWNGLTSGWSEEVVFPWPFTNYVAVSLPVSNLLVSSDPLTPLTDWQPALTNLFINPTDSLYFIGVGSTQAVSIQQTNNLTGYASPD